MYLTSNASQIVFLVLLNANKMCNINLRTTMGPKRPAKLWKFLLFLTLPLYNQQNLSHLFLQNNENCIWNLIKCKIKCSKRRRHQSSADNKKNGKKRNHWNSAGPNRPCECSNARDRMICSKTWLSELEVNFHTNNICK